MKERCSTCIDKDTCDLRKQAIKLGNVIEKCYNWRSEFDPDNGRGL